MRNKTFEKISSFHKEFVYPNHACGILKTNVLDANDNLDQRIGERMLRFFKREGLLGV